VSIRLFFEDAEIVSRALELVLAGRNGVKEIRRIAMAGISHHALDSCLWPNEMEAASESQRLVRREVTRFIALGTVIEEGDASGEEK